MKIILKALLLTTLVGVFCSCAFILLGLILNLWNMSIIDASLASTVSIIVGGITYFAIETALNAWKGSSHPF